MNSANAPKGLPDTPGLPILTVLVGAGSSVALGIPGTEELTRAVSGLDYPALNVAGRPYFKDARLLTTQESIAVPAIRLLTRALNAAFGKSNFEHMLHAVESLQGLAAAQSLDERLGDIRPVLSAFTEVSTPWEKLVDFSLLTDLLNAMLRTIASAVIEGQDRSSTTAPRRVQQEYASFFASLRKKFVVRIFTLNYDLTVDRLGSWEDGFHDDNALGAEFSRVRYYEGYDTGRHLISHLHGSVSFGFKMRNPGAVKFPSPQVALESYTSRRPPRPDVSGELFESAPLISGLRKLDKINSTPYATYFNSFGNSLLQSPLLLICGYGFNDPHVNYWLGEHRARHSTRRHVVVVGRRALQFHEPGGKLSREDVVHRGGQRRLRPLRDHYSGIMASPELINIIDGFPPNAHQTRFVGDYLQGRFPVDALAMLRRTRRKRR